MGTASLQAKKAHHCYVGVDGGALFGKGYRSVEIPGLYLHRGSANFTPSAGLGANFGYRFSLERLFFDLDLSGFFFDTKHIAVRYNVKPDAVYHLFSDLSFLNQIMVGAGIGYHIKAYQLYGKMAVNWTEGRFRFRDSISFTKKSGHHFFCPVWILGCGYSWGSFTLSGEWRFFHMKGQKKDMVGKASLGENFSFRAHIFCVVGRYLIPLSKD